MRILERYILKRLQRGKDGEVHILAYVRCDTGYILAQVSLKLLNLSIYSICCVLYMVGSISKMVSSKGIIFYSTCVMYLIHAALCFMV